MSRRAKPSHVYLARLTIPCPKHGEHRLIVIGSDDLACLAGDVLATALRQDGHTVMVKHMSLPFDEAAEIANGWELNIDDLPW